MTTAPDAAWEELHDALARVQDALADADRERDLYARSGRAIPPFIVKRRTMLRALTAEMSMTANDPDASLYELRRSTAILNNAVTYGVPSPRAPKPLSESTPQPQQLHHV